MEVGKVVLTLIAYDVDTSNSAGQKRLRKVAKCCVNYGQRVQNSVFECSADAATMVRVKKELLEIIDQEKDSLRFYNLGNHYKNRVEHYGTKQSYDPEGFLTI